MQNLKIEEKLSKHEAALSVHNLYVKEDLSPEEVDQFEALLQKKLAELKAKKLDKQSEPDVSLSDLMPLESVELPDNQEPEDVVKTPKVPTLAAQINKGLNTGAVKVKRVMNGEYPEEQLGNVHTPVKTVGKDITNSRFFVSPGGTTATYKQTVKVSVKKVSGGQFVEPASETDSSLTSSF
jgi:hypothetical protein